MTQLHFFSLLSLFFLSIFHCAAQSPSGDNNRTFTLTSLNAENATFNNIPITRGNPSGMANVGILTSETYDLHIFLWNDTLYTYCDTSSTGVCVIYWRKNYRGILMGWSLTVDDDEVFSINDPCCSYTGGWSVQTIDGKDYLSSSGSTEFEMCDVDPNATGLDGYVVSYAVTEYYTCYWGSMLAISWDY